MRAFLLSFVMLTGCVANLDAEDTQSRPTGNSARSVGMAHFDETGTSQVIDLNPAADARMALHATGAQDVCFELEGRGAPARRASLDVIEEGVTSVRYRRVRCSTGTPLREPLEDALEVVARALEEPPERGQISLRVIITEHSALLEDDALLEDLNEALALELAPIQITPVISGQVEVRGVPEVASFTDLETSELDAMLALAPSPSEGIIDVVFAGCLRRLDPLGTPSVVAGFTGRVGGGGGGGADAIFLPGLHCDRLSRGPVAFDAALTAHVLAHEVGHFLGLSHTEDVDNIMHANPTLASAQHFTPAQSLAMRSHPFVRAR